IAVEPAASRGQSPLDPTATIARQDPYRVVTDDAKTDVQGELPAARSHAWRLTIVAVGLVSLILVVGVAINLSPWKSQTPAAAFTPPETPKPDERQPPPVG